MRVFVLVVSAVLASWWVAPDTADASCCKCVCFDFSIPCFTTAPDGDACETLCYEFCEPRNIGYDPEEDCAQGGSGGFDDCTWIDPTPPSTPTVTQTPIDTPTVTPTATPVAQGGFCTDASQCVTGFCSDNVCCDTACTGVGQACNLPGEQGTCVSAPSPAPPASNAGLATMMAAALLVAFFGLRKRVAG